MDRCRGAGCSRFRKVATPTGTTYSDSGLLPNTSYSYRVRASDAAGNLGPYSNTASGTTTGIGADFNGDGQPDLLLQNTATGDIVVWYLNRATRIGSDYINQGTDLAWKVVGP